MTKESFEKIRSLVERKHLFEYLIDRGGTIFCKGPQENSLFRFRPKSISPDRLVIGSVQAIDLVPSVSTDVIGCFPVGRDRYFLLGKLLVRGRSYQLPIALDLYKLQRRQGMRVSVPPHFPIEANLIEVRNRRVATKLNLVDLSNGGMRICFDSLMSLRIGDKIKAVLHPTSGTSIEVTGAVKHIQNIVHNGHKLPQYGIVFIETHNAVKNRLFSLTLDIQQRLIKGI